MKAILVSGFGPPEVLRLTALPDAAPGRARSPSTSPTRQSACSTCSAGRGCTVTGPGCRNHRTCLAWRWPARCVPWATARPGSTSASPW